MKKKFITNLAFLLFLNLLIKPFYVLGIDVGIQNSVSAATYGIYFPLLSLSLMFQVILDMGLDNFTRREIARDNSLLSRYMVNIIVLKLFLAVIYFCFCLLIGIISNYSLFQLKLLIILLFNQFIASFILYMRANIGGLHLFKTESIISVLDKLILIIICSFLLWGKITHTSFKIEWFIYAQTFSYSVTLLIATLVISSKEKLKVQLDIKTYSTIIKKSLPYALLVLLMGSYYRIDSVLLERMLPDGKVQAGIYAHSFRLLDMLQNYGFLFSIILLPMFSIMLKNKESVSQLVNISLVIIIVPALIVSIGSFYYKTEIIDLLYNEHIKVSSNVFGIIMPGFIPICISYIFGTLLTANGNLKQLIIIAVIGTLLSFLLNIILIPEIGVKGSAIANISAQSITACLQLITAVKIFKPEIDKKLAFKLIVYIILLLICGYLTKLINTYWILNLSLYLLMASLIMLAIRLIKIRSIFNFFYGKIN